ncbi:MAG TPA: alpha/beta fold hydrolase [Solirubrobacterales bacterium]|nr:alpha/beta fold hydrolase [Solirubrobacterales bacterium]
MESRLGIATPTCRRWAVSVLGLKATFTPSHRGGSGTPMVCLHGFTDTWRTWELVLPDLEREHDVLAPTLPGHAGGPPIDGEITEALLADAVERAMDEAGFETAHLVGNSLGGYVCLQLAARGRAETVVALAPAGGWPDGDESFRETLAFFSTMQKLVKIAAPHAETILASDDGGRRGTEFLATNYEHIPTELIAHGMLGAASCTGAMPLMEHADREGWNLEAEKIECPVRVVWGSADRILHWPIAAARFRDSWLPQADWVELDGIGHCPQLDVPPETARLILDFSAR